MNKRTLGILSFAPLSLLIVSVFLVNMARVMGIKNDVAIVVMGAIAIIGIITSIVLTYATMMHLLSWACKQSIFSEKDLQTWTWIFYFFNMLIYPFFWLAHIAPGIEEDVCVERTRMSKTDARNYAFTPLEGLGIWALLFFAERILKEIIPIAGVIVGLFLFIMLGVLSIYTVWVEIKFLVEVAKSPVLSPFKKALWAMFLYAFVFIALPVYWWLHMSHEDSRLSREEREGIRKRNREFTRNRRKEQREKRKGEKCEEYKQGIEELSKGRVIAFFAILPAACLICTIVLMVSWVSIYSDFDEVIYALLSCTRFLLIGSGLIAWGLYMVSLWTDVRHTIKDKILWSISMTVFNVLLFPVYWNKYLRNKSQLQEEKQKKHVLVVSVLPFLFFSIFMILGNTTTEFVTSSIVLEIVFVLATVFLLVSYLFSLVVFSVKVLDNPQFSVVKKVSWIVALLLVGIIAAPLYCRRHIFKEI